MQSFTSDFHQTMDSVLCIEGSRINITIWLLFWKLMFGQSNLNFLSSCNRVKTYDCGERIADWLSTFLGRPCRLIRQSSDVKNKSHQKNTKGMLSFLKIFVIPHANIRLMDFTEYIGTLIKAERVIQYWSSHYVCTQIDFLLPFYLLNLVKMCRCTSMGGSYHHDHDFVWKLKDQLKKWSWKI